MNGEKFTLIDTAGMRRKRSIKENPEKFSVSKSIDSIKRSDLVILLVDGSENIVDQDIHLLGLTLAIGRPVILVANKIDLLNKTKKLINSIENINKVLEIKKIISSRNSENKDSKKSLKKEKAKTKKTKIKKKFKTLWVRRKKKV